MVLAPRRVVEPLAVLGERRQKPRDVDMPDQLEMLARVRKVSRHAWIIPPADMTRALEAEATALMKSPVFSTLPISFGDTQVCPGWMLCVWVVVLPVLALPPLATRWMVTVRATLSTLVTVSASMRVVVFVPLVYIVVLAFGMKAAATSCWR